MQVQVILVPLILYFELTFYPIWANSTVFLARDLSDVLSCKVFAVIGKSSLIGVIPKKKKRPQSYTYKYATVALSMQ